MARFRSLADAEPWIAAGVPVGMSYAWKPGMLTGAPVRSSDGHLGVLVGFDANGDPVVNDPAGKGDARPAHLQAGRAGERLAQPLRRDGLPGLPAGLVDSLEHGAPDRRRRRRRPPRAGDASSAA